MKGLQRSVSPFFQECLQMSSYCRRGSLDWSRRCFLLKILHWKAAHSIVVNSGSHCGYKAINLSFAVLGVLTCLKSIIALVNLGVNVVKIQ